MEMVIVFGVTSSSATPGGNGGGGATTKMHATQMKQFHYYCYFVSLLAIRLRYGRISEMVSKLTKLPNLRPLMLC